MRKLVNNIKKELYNRQVQSKNKRRNFYNKHLRRKRRRTLRKRKTLTIATLRLKASKS